MSIGSKIEALSDAHAKTSSSKAYKRLAALFDDGSFTELASLAKSSDGFTEAAAAHGYADGAGFYAFAQNSDIAGGAMSKAQAAKIKKVYDLALKTGEPVVAVYDSIGGRLDEGNELLAAYGDVLRYSNNLSGVVPQISVVLGKCFGTQALIAACADIVIISENAELSLNTDGSDSKAENAYKKGVAHILAKDDEQALEYARKLVSALPSNNLSGACVAYESVDAQAQTDISMTASQAAAAVCDADSAVELQAAYGEGAKTIISTINGNTVGVIALDSKTLNGKACSKAARFIRFCDAFSLPVISFVDAEKFECIKCAAKLTSAYAEATTAKITVITGDAFGSVYIAAAGTGAAADITLAWPDAYVSALSPEAAAVIMLGDDFGGKLKGSKDPKNDRAAVVAQFKDENLTAFSAAGNGYIDDIINAEETREKLITAIDMLSNKRISTLPKKHNNLYI